MQFAGLMESLFGAGLVFGAIRFSDLNSWVESQLASSGNVFVSGLLLFVGGLLASLLPCVYPLYPITVSIIRKRGGDSHRLLHPLAYYCGLLAVYTSFGVIAAISGGAFNEILRLGVTNLAISILFALLALSTAGWLEIPIFQGRDISVRPGPAGTFILGGAAGMLSSACVGPVVVGILLRLASTSHEGSMLTNVIAGGSQMLAFGMGVGLTFLVIALFGVSLPKSGNWMVAVQYLLALGIGYFSYLYLQKGLAILEFPDHTALALTISAITFVAFGYAIQSENVTTAIRVRRAVLALGAVIAGVMINQSLQVNSTERRDVIASNQSKPTVENDGNLTWHLDDVAAYEQAQLEGKPVFIDFYGAWCTNCKAFQELTHSNQELNAALQRAVLLKVRDRVPLFKKYVSDERFPELKIGLPFFVITDYKKNLLYKTSDYLKTDEMALFLSE